MYLNRWTSFHFNRLYKALFKRGRKLKADRPDQVHKTGFEVAVTGGLGLARIIVIISAKQCPSHAKAS